MFTVLGTEREVKKTTCPDCKVSQFCLSGIQYSRQEEPVNEITCPACKVSQFSLSDIQYSRQEKTVKEIALPACKVSHFSPSRKDRVYAWKIRYAIFVSFFVQKFA
jgi:hypothetical protein